jgi:hypothetical protein
MRTTRIRIVFVAILGVAALSPLSRASVTSEITFYAPSFVSVGEGYCVEAWADYEYPEIEYYEETLFFDYNIFLYMNLYKNGSLVEAYSNYYQDLWHAGDGIAVPCVDTVAGTVEYMAEAYDDYGGSYECAFHYVAAGAVDVGTTHGPYCWTTVDGFFMDDDLKERARPAGQSVTLTARFKATDGSGCLSGIRPNILAPDGTLDDNGGIFVPQSGYEGEVVRTATLNQNGVWYFWTEAQDETMQPSGAYSSEGSNSVYIGVYEIPNIPPIINLAAVTSSLAVGEIFNCTGSVSDPDGSISRVAIQIDGCVLGDAVVNGAVFSFSLPLPLHTVGIHEVRAVAYDAQGTVTLSDGLNFTVTQAQPPIGNGFADWALAHGLDPGNPYADSDGDGISNMNEYRLGTDPLVSQTTASLILAAPEDAYYNVNTGTWEIAPAAAP